MALINLMKFIWNHPFNKNNKVAAISRFVKWQINGLINPYPVIYQLTENSKMVAKKGMTGVTGNIYSGLLEFADMLFLLHLLRPEDTFYDIGANVGVYTILASGEIGANTVSVEPIPGTFTTLQLNIAINQINDKVKALNMAVGDKEGTIGFTTELDTVNHVATNLEISSGTVINVNIYKLDDLIKGPVPLLLKIDVEGYETSVINGAEKLLKNPELKAIIIELNGSGERYGYNDEYIHNKLFEYGFSTNTYDPHKKELIALKSFGIHNTLYLRDLDFIKSRISSSRKIKIQDQQF